MQNHKMLLTKQPQNHYDICWYYTYLSERAFDLLHGRESPGEGFLVDPQHGDLARGLRQAAPHLGLVLLQRVQQPLQQDV